MWIVDILVPDRCYPLVVTLFLFNSLAFIAVSLRIYTRRRVLKRMGADDYLIMVAMLCSTIYLIVTLLGQLTWGLGTPTLDQESISHFQKAQYADVLAYNVSAIMTKFSLLFQYRRVFMTPRSRPMFTGLLVWLSVFAAFIVPMSLFTCIPVQSYWETELNGHCLNYTALMYATAAFNIANDFVLLGVPILFLRGLWIDRRTKIALFAIFTCGAFACIVSIIRLWALSVSSAAPINEQAIHGVDITMWSGLEINIAIICASVPSLHALAKKLMPKLAFPEIRSHRPKDVPLSSLGGSPTLPAEPQAVVHPRESPAVQNREEQERNYKMAITVNRTVTLKSISSDEGLPNTSQQDLLASRNAWAACYAGRAGSNARLAV